jgi:hypothetical protein
MDWLITDVGVSEANALSGESEPRDNRGSFTGPVIELATIDERHRRKILLETFGAQVILRLAVAPARLPREVLKRAIRVDRTSPATGENRWEEVREIGWSGLSGVIDRCGELSMVVNEHDITEYAAIGVMLLLIHELEGAVLTGVLQIGSGPDYVVQLSDRPEPVRVEVSGIKSGSASQASSRLGEKRGRLREAGFVSVTTFQRGEDEMAHSYLHFVIPGTGSAKTNRGHRKGTRGKRS